MPADMRRWAYIQAARGNWAAAEDLFRQALALDPNDPDALHLYSQMLATVGRLKEALSLREKLRTLEPFVPIYNINTAGSCRSTDRARPASRSSRRYLPTPREANIRNVISRRPMRRPDAMARRRTRFSPFRKPESGFPAIGGRRRAAAAQRSGEGQGAGSSARIGGRAELRLRLCRRAGPRLGISRAFPQKLFGILLYAPVRKTERFKAFVRNAGLVDYWRARGWPDLCRPMGADDFVCD